MLITDCSLQRSRAAQNSSNATVLQLECDPSDERSVEGSLLLEDNAALNIARVTLLRDIGSERGDEVFP